MMEGNEKHEREEIFAKAVRAGKRTYFFDVRATRNNDYYLTITESKRKYNDDGTFRYQKHKIFLYKEDFEKFSNALSETIKKIIELNAAKNAEIADRIDDKFTDISFEDLGHNGEGAKEDVEAVESSVDNDDTPTTEG